MTTSELEATAEAYRSFAHVHTRAHSPAYERVSAAVAESPELLDRLLALPPIKRQPNLLLAAVRYLGGPSASGEAFLAWTLEHWARVRAVMLARATQTNEAGRCATLLPLLAALPQPLALIEVGASAGLCLYPDRYRYRYDRASTFGADGSPVTLDCATTGPVPFPGELPRVASRAGVDLSPLDPAAPDDARWLESLVWPGQQQRLDRLRAALSVARAEPEPARIVRGDLNAVVAELVAAAPAGATPVVFHSAVLTYLPLEARQAFTAAVRELPCRWISNEAPGVLPEVDARLSQAAPTDRGVFVLSLDGEPQAFTGPHGERLDWFPPHLTLG
ncbi:DUF2332 domain-containing protein [Streptacidiphilus jiangxiensis]|uniref:DUF2332 domain-containing protein n=1 Tax=Streptacidiphilus jiangxiensis TaxID=235985 RepID=A0A1H7ZGQ2_STRJI|nr:DUF2332 domain-containing protein [Streptacidiphilus jiangxiensis]SEM57732.1 hypothetical protein SAMN05414137_13528 [Streptacidiphilus jiangxiensis]